MYWCLWETTCHTDTGEAFSRLSTVPYKHSDMSAQSVHLFLSTVQLFLWHVCLLLLASTRHTCSQVVSLTPTGDWHQSRLVSCDRPNPERGLWLAGGRHPVRLLSGDQHWRHVDLAPPAECHRCSHFLVLPCTSSSHVSVCKNTKNWCSTRGEFNLLLLQMKFLVLCGVHGNLPVRFWYFLCDKGKFLPD